MRRTSSPPLPSCRWAQEPDLAEQLSPNGLLALQLAPYGVLICTFIETALRPGKVTLGLAVVVSNPKPTHPRKINQPVTLPGLTAVSINVHMSTTMWGSDGVVPSLNQVSSYGQLENRHESSHC